MENYKSFITDLSNLLNNARTSRDKSRDKYKALERVTKSASALIRDFENLQNVERSEK